MTTDILISAIAIALAAGVGLIIIRLVRFARDNGLQ